MPIIELAVAGLVAGGSFLAAAWRIYDPIRLCLSGTFVSAAEHREFERLQAEIRNWDGVEETTLVRPEDVAPIPCSMDSAMVLEDHFGEREEGSPVSEGATPEIMPATPRESSTERVGISARRRKRGVRRVEVPAPTSPQPPRSPPTPKAAPKPKPKPPGPDNRIMLPTRSYWYRLIVTGRGYFPAMENTPVNRLVVDRWVVQKSAEHGVRETHVASYKHLVTTMILTPDPVQFYAKAMEGAALHLAAAYERPRLDFVRTNRLWPTVAHTSQPFAQ